MQAGPPRRRCARPVADAPIEALLPAVDDLAKGWLLACIEDAPLGAAQAILAADLAQDAPRICDAVVRTLADDLDLRRVEPGGALEPLVARAGELMGASDAQAASRAVDALHAVIWSALRDQLRSPEAEQVAALAERLSAVTSLVRAAVLRGATSASAPLAGLRPAPAPPPPRIHLAPDPVATGQRAQSEEAAEHDLAQAEPAGEASSHAAYSAVADPLWLGAVEDEIERSQRTGAQLSLLLVELEDGARISAVESHLEAAATFGRFAQALRTALRRQDILACENASRAWVIARDTGRPGAQALADRCVRAVREAQPWRDAPLAVSVGMAVFGEDGREREELIDTAKEEKFAASASGVAVGANDGEELPPSAV